MSLYGRKRHYLVHRLVAAAFCPQPEGTTQVNHINERKEDNHAYNLEWVTPKQNMNHCYSCISLQKKVRKLEKELDKRPKL
jgi:hypothetical protein